MAKKALRFFRKALDDANEGISRLAREWIEEVETSYPWPTEESETDGLRLLHSYDGPIWLQIEDKLASDQPSNFFIMSPFHDNDARLHQALSHSWPKAKAEVLVQQSYTKLPVTELSKLKNFALSEIRNSSRRVHAKVFAWKGRSSGGCIVGSANFTSAAMDGSNVEAVLMISDAWDLIEKLFDSQLKKRPIDFEDFEVGEETSPEEQPWTAPRIVIVSAILTEKKQLEIHFKHELSRHPDQIRLILRLPGELHPRISLLLPRHCKEFASVTLPDTTLNDCNGIILASLRMEIDQEVFESPPTWVIQEGKLTFESSEGATDSRSRIEETGEGLLEYLEQIGNQQGMVAVAELLALLNIKFFDGGGGFGGFKRFRVKITDPFESNTLPDWLLIENSQATTLCEAILEFVHRHERYKLKKHADRGNINGMGNFLDILKALVRLLYVYYKRGFVPRMKVIGRLCEWCELATSGRDTETEFFNGYLFSMWNNLDGDEELLQSVVDEHRFCAELRAMLLIAQKLRYVPGEIPSYDKPPKSQKDVLKKQSEIIGDAIAECGLEEPYEAQVREVLERYQMFTPEEIQEMLAAL